MNINVGDGTACSLPSLVLAIGYLPSQVQGGPLLRKLSIPGDKAHSLYSSELSEVAVPAALLLALGSSMYPGKPMERAQAFETFVLFSIFLLLSL